MTELTYKHFHKVIEKVLSYVAAQYYWVEDLEKEMGRISADIAKGKKAKPDYGKARKDVRKIARSERKLNRYEDNLLNGLHELHKRMPPKSSASYMLYSLMGEIGVEESTLIKDASRVHGKVMEKLADLGHAINKGDEIAAQRAVDDLKKLTADMEKWEKATITTGKETDNLLKKMSKGKK